MTALTTLWAALCVALIVGPFLATLAAFNPPAWPTRLARGIRAAAHAYGQATAATPDEMKTRLAAGGW